MRVIFGMLRGNLQDKWCASWILTDAHVLVIPSSTCSFGDIEVCLDLTPLSLLHHAGHARPRLPCRHRHSQPKAARPGPAHPSRDPPSPGTPDQRRRPPLRPLSGLVTPLARPSGPRPQQPLLAALAPKITNIAVVLSCVAFTPEWGNTAAAYRLRSRVPAQ
jgi:hypothetical protein